MAKLDPVQLQLVLKAITREPPMLSSGDWIASAAVVIALIAAGISWLIFKRQERSEMRRYAAQLHVDWWQDEFAKKRAIVWRSLEEWRLKGDASRAIQNYARLADDWAFDGEEMRAHSRVLFFFADIESLIANRLVDEDLALELFGVAQYQWFRGYFTAIVNAIGSRAPSPEDTPRFVGALEAFEQRLDRWLQRRPARRRRSL